MKKFILKTLLVSTLFIAPSISQVFSQPPPPPPPGGGHGKPGNKTVPVGEGIFILAGLAVLYGGYKLVRTMKTSEPEA